MKMTSEIIDNKQEKMKADLAAIKGTKTFDFVPFAPAIVFVFGIACSLMGYGLSLPIRKKKI